MAQHLDKAIDIVQIAIDEDAKQNYAEAYKLYQNSLDYFMVALKHHPSEPSKVLIREKIKEYLTRVETLKQHLLEEERRSSGEKFPAASGRARRWIDKEDKNDYDPEVKKLRAQLASVTLADRPNVSWDDVAGLEGAKASLKEAIVLPIKFPHLFKGKRTPWKGILLYGPPGAGKSFLAKAVATEANSTFFNINSSDLLSKWQGDSERLVKQLFDMAREQKPSIIFLDKIECLACTGNGSESEGIRRIKTELLVQMNGVGHDNTGVLVLGATNVPWQLDNAIKQRFEKRIYIPLPGPEARRRMFELNVGDTPCECTPENWRKLADMTDGYSGSDIFTLVRDAIMQPIRKVMSATHFKRIEDLGDGGRLKWTPCSPCALDAVEMSWMDVEGEEVYEPKVTFLDFRISVQQTPKTTVEADLKRYEDWTAASGFEGA
ncbi:P-loop containing nucleoside triphosphate hydrolase protein [Flagelloscypha sp. PMI_526]|nr:P-loop containing nucleoside triphosphate hydrolase protein [Flagelloscypha sp. PMI_526]